MSFRRVSLASLGALKSPCGPRKGPKTGFRACFSVGGEIFFCLGRRSSDFLIFDRCLKRFACFCFGNFPSFGSIPTLVDHLSQQVSSETATAPFPSLFCPVCTCLGPVPDPPGEDLGVPKGCFGGSIILGALAALPLRSNVAFSSRRKPFFGSCFSVGGGVFCDGRRRFSCFVLKFFLWSMPPCRRHCVVIDR